MLIPVEINSELNRRVLLAFDLRTRMPSQKIHSTRNLLYHSIGQLKVSQQEQSFHMTSRSNKKYHRGSTNDYLVFVYHKHRMCLVLKEGVQYSRSYSLVVQYVINWTLTPRFKKYVRFY